MKKRWFMALALLMILAALCTACSKTEQPDAETPEATELPSITAPPAEDAGGESGLEADENNAPEQLDPEAARAEMSEDQRKAEDLKGALVEELYAAIGQPKNAEYTTSCLVADGQDGLLTYDGFLVSTTRYPNGEEYVMGTTN